MFECMYSININIYIYGDLLPFLLCELLMDQIILLRETDVLKELLFYLRVQILN